jgi:hypothetical protein
MIIRVEPKEFFMSTVYLIFDRLQSEAEDEEVKRYLAERRLEPKRTFEAAYQERDSQVWQFGGCYLGKHLDVIVEIQRKHLEEEMLAYEIPRLLKERADAEVHRAVGELSAGRMQELVHLLVKEFHRESSFGSDEEAGMKVTLEPTVVQQRFKELLSI